MSMFNRVFIEISNLCNLNCSFCPIDERSKEILSIEQFTNILDQASPLADEICLHLMGEPMMHPNFDEILDICEHKGVKIKLTTNGILIPKFFEKILNSKSIRQINFSLQSYMDNFPNKNLDEYLGNILRFSQNACALRPDLYINLRLWTLKEGDSEYEEVLSVIENSFDVKIKRKVDVTNYRSKKIKGRVYVNFDSKFDWPSLDLPFVSSKGTCVGLKTHIGIHADGTVVPCCLDTNPTIVLGNCFENDLLSIVNSKRALKIKDGFKNNIITEDLCQHCSFRKRFKCKASN